MVPLKILLLRTRKIRRGDRRDGDGESCVGAQWGGSYNRESRLGLVPLVQSKITRMLHSPPRQVPLRHLYEQEGGAAKRAYVRLIGPREKDIMAFAKVQRCTLFRHHEDNLWRETLGKCLGFHDRGI